MNKTKLFLAVAVLALTMLACTFTINSDMRGVEVGPLETYEIEVPARSADEITKVNLKFGAGDLTISPGSADWLVSGTATYNVADLKPKVTETDSRVEISPQVDDLNLFPRLGADIKNQWDLALGESPMELEIFAGGYQGEYEFGGIPLHELRIAEGAANTSLSFSEVNPVVMDMMRYETGASKASLSGLANANFRDFDFRSGAGDYLLDFSGELQQDAEVQIKSGLSSIVIVVPEGTPATLRFKSGLANVDVGGEWSSSGSEYTLEGEGPALNITIDMGAGNLELRN